MECRNCYGAVAKMIEPKDAEIARLTQQLAAAKEYAERLREALLVARQYMNNKTAEECNDKYAIPVNEALALPKPWEQGARKE